MIAIGSVFVHLTIHPQSYKVRGIAIQIMEATAASLRQLVSLMLREALAALLVEEKSTPVKSALVKEEDEKPNIDMQRRYYYTAVARRQLQEKKMIH